MATSSRAPAGRAGRLWLTHRIDVAERAADQLERKIHVLSLEIARQQEVADAARLAWSDACANAREHFRPERSRLHSGARFDRPKRHSASTPGCRRRKAKSQARW